MHEHASDAHAYHDGNCDPNGHEHADGDAAAHGHGDQHANPGADGHRHEHSHASADGDRDPCADQHATTDRNAYSPDTDSGAAYPNTATHRNLTANSYAAADSNTGPANSDSGATHCDTSTYGHATTDRDSASNGDACAYEHASAATGGDSTAYTAADRDAQANAWARPRRHGTRPRTERRTSGQRKHEQWRSGRRQASSSQVRRWRNRPGFRPRWESHTAGHPGTRDLAAGLRGRKRGLLASPLSRRSGRLACAHQRLPQTLHEIRPVVGELSRVGLIRSSATRYSKNEQEV